MSQTKQNKTKKVPTTFSLSLCRSLTLLHSSQLQTTAKATSKMLVTASLIVSLKATDTGGGHLEGRSRSSSGESRMRHTHLGAVGQREFKRGRLDKRNETKRKHTRKVE